MATQAQMQVRELGSVQVYVREDPGCCPLCGGVMGVQKTGPRIGRTLAHGAFEARETVHQCLSKCRQASGTLVTRRAACLSESLMPGGNIGYDVMVFVGQQRFVHHRQREEIQAALLAQHGLSMSTGEVSALSRRFVQYLSRLHHARSAELKAVMDKDGGWPLHIDATGEAGRGTLLIAMAG